jgi:hypothetical protein
LDVSALEIDLLQGAHATVRKDAYAKTVENSGSKSGSLSKSLAAFDPDIQW